MNSKIKFKQIEHEESNAVISLEDGTTFKISKLMKNLNDFFINSVLYELSEKLNQIGLGTPPNYKGGWNNSIDAEILEPKSEKWKKGKVRMRVVLEFCPDEPEIIQNNPVQNNSLDDIRHSISS